MTRIRSTPANQDVFAHYEHFGPSVGTADKGSLTTPYSVWGKTDSMEDEVTVGYFAKARSGDALPVNPMIQEKYSIELTQDSCSFAFYDESKTPQLRATINFEGSLAAASYASHIGSSGNKWFRTWASTPSWPSDATVLQAALANANSASFDLLTFAAEFDKTNELVRRFGNRTLKRSRDILESMQRRYRRREITYRAFSESWLEYRYGWRILMFDLEAMNESAERLIEGIQQRNRFSAYDEKTTEYTATNIGSVIKRFPSNVSYSSRLTGVQSSFTQTRKRSVKAGVAVEHLGQDMYMADPLVTTWELVPFSFIADWFFTLGDAIKAHSPFASTNLLWSYVTTEDEQTTVVTSGLENLDHLNSTFGTDYSVSEGIPESVATFKYLQYERQPQTPTISLETDINFDYKKALDLASLGPVLMSIVGGKLSTIRKATRL